MVLKWICMACLDKVSRVDTSYNLQSSLWKMLAILHRDSCRQARFIDLHDSHRSSFIFILPAQIFYRPYSRLHQAAAPLRTCFQLHLQLTGLGLRPLFGWMPILIHHLKANVPKLLLAWKCGSMRTTTIIGPWHHVDALHPYTPKSSMKHFNAVNMFCGLHRPLWLWCHKIQHNTV